MVEYQGRTYQTCDGFNNAKILLRALCKDGRVNASIFKGKQMQEAYKLLDGKIKPNKEYLITYEELSLLNADVIMRNSYGELVFLYSI